MAKINKQEVIQKLIDELNLYPGKDLIPSELADKILAVYQINEQAVNFQPEGMLRFIKDAALNDPHKTAVVPAGKKWELLYCSCIYAATADAGNRLIEFEIGDGTDVYFKTASETVITASDTTLFIFGSGHQDTVGFTPTQLGADFVQNIGIPNGLILNAGHTIFMGDITPTSANDDLTTFILVRESDLRDDFSV